jgi:hypothetical protein
MIIQVNANGLGPDAGGLSTVESEIRRRLARFERRLTRVEIHFEDVNADRGGSCDKRCLIELRPRSAAPIAVSDCASNIGPSIAGAAAKAVAALDTHFGKMDARR